MATIKVSGQAQLLSALKSAKAGDTLSLAGGNYGNITMPTAANGGQVTIKSASDSHQAVFSKLTASRVSNFTIDNVKFDGAGGSNGLKINFSKNVKVLNSDFTDYKYGSMMYDISGLTHSNNTYTRMYEDAMQFTDIQTGVISKNVYRESGSQPGYSHKDFIQFWTHKGFDQAASKNIKITDNQFYSNDGQTHGIFINNEVGTEKYQNIYIANNYLKASHTHAITLDYGNNIEIRNNTVIKNGSGTPVINVTPDSTNVKIIGNTSPGIPDKGNSSWTVSGNKETAGNAYQWTDGKSGIPIKSAGSSAGSSATPSAGSATPEDTIAPETPTIGSDTSSQGSGSADDFVFKGAAVKGATTNTVSALDFTEDDEIVFIGYNNGTFKDDDGGNLVVHSLDGAYVRIDSLADIEELVTNSPDIGAKVSGDTLTLTIEQDAGTQTLVLAGLGEEYQNLL